MPEVQVFAKRFWGFDPVTWPIVSFALDGNRDALLRESRPGDLVLFIGTQTEQTEPAERGRLLGLAEFARNEIEASEVLDYSSLDASAFDEHGRMRWPKALPMTRAWRFVPTPRVVEVLRAQLPYSATVRAVLLDAADTAAVLALPREEVRVADTGPIERLRRMNDALTFGSPTTGPRPISWVGTTGRNAEDASSTYAFRFGSRDVWKIGHAKDVRARLAEVNKHVPEEVLREGWRVALQHSWPTEIAAYEMEQRVLAALRTRLSVGERVICTQRDMESTWSACLIP